MRYAEDEPRYQLQSLPAAETSVELIHSPHPGRAMRVLIGIREVAAIVALVLASILMVLLLTGFARLASAVSELDDPAPAVTECFGEEPC